MKADAVFEGGGMRGIGIIGALRYFEIKGYSWNNIAGSSAGAIIAALLAAGYSAKDMKKMMIETDFIKFLDKRNLQRIPIIGKAVGLIKDKGIYSGEYFENWIQEALERRGINKFKDVSINKNSKLKIIASDITKKDTIVLPDDLKNYGIDPMEFSIAKAVRMSISIPFYFKPVTLKHNGGNSYIVDGGLTCNYPISIFDTENIPISPTFGFKFDNKNISNTAAGKHDPISFIFDIAGTMNGENRGEFLKQENLARTIFIPTNGVEATDFKLSREVSLRLYRDGFRSAKKFLNLWNFEEYIKTFKKNFTA